MMSTTNLPKISDDLFGLVVKLNTQIFNQDEFLKTLHIPPSHVKVIFYLVHKGPTPVSVIGEQLRISKSNMTPIIDKLIAEGLVSRSEDPKDRRVILIARTEKAIELFNAHTRCIKQRLSEKIAHLSAEDLADLHQGTQLILPILDKFI